MNTCGSSHFLVIGDVPFSPLKARLAGGKGTFCKPQGVKSVRHGRTSNHTWTYGCNFFVVHCLSKPSRNFVVLVPFFWPFLFVLTDRRGYTPTGVISDKLFDHLKIPVFIRKCEVELSLVHNFAVNSYNSVQPKPTSMARTVVVLVSIWDRKIFPSRSHNDKAKGKRVEVSLKNILYILWCSKLLQTMYTYLLKFL